MRMVRHVLIGAVAVLSLAACSSMDRNGSGSGSSGMSGMSGSSGSSEMRGNKPPGSNPSSDNGTDDGEGSGGSNNAARIGAPPGGYFPQLVYPPQSQTH